MEGCTITTDPDKSVRMKGEGTYTTCLSVFYIGQLLVYHPV